MTLFQIYLALVVTAIIAVAVQSLIDVAKKNFYAQPVGKRCRYYFSGKWIKGTVEWNNGQHYYITPDCKKMATDLVNRKDVKPILFF